MAEIRARQAADYFITFSHKVGDSITNLKLQKLLYYAQGWYLAQYSGALFDERIEAWPHGPVVPPVYGYFKKYEWGPIAENPQTQVLHSRVAAHLQEIMDVYGVLTAYQLERQTHTEDPWVEARKGLPLDEPSHAIIGVASMRRYFKAQLSHGKNTTS